MRDFKNLQPQETPSKWMGLRVRLKAGVDISTYPAQAQVVLTALKRYGMILADTPQEIAALAKAVSHDARLRHSLRSFVGALHQGNLRRRALVARLEGRDQALERRILGEAEEERGAVHAVGALRGPRDRSRGVATGFRLASGRGAHGFGLALVHQN